MENPNGDTPDQKKDQKPAGTGTDTPPASGSSPDPVEELKNQVTREQARAATALKDKEDADKRARNEKILRIRAEKALKAATSGSGDGNNPPAAGSEVNDLEEEQVRLEAEKGIFGLLAGTSAYNELLSKDPTLKEVLLTNPLSLIREYIDPEDAVDQIKKKLDDRVQSLSSSTPPSGDGKKDVVPPKDGGVEMKGSITPKQATTMSPDEWAKLPKEQRLKMLQGEF